jgi:hypothetical protein
MARPRIVLATAATLLAVLNAPPVLAAGRHLSDEVHVTRWAYPRYDAPARSAPSVSARRVVSLHLLTEDGFPEVYVLLSSLRDAHGTTWVRVRLPQRPNGTTGWVVRGALGDFRVVHTKVVVNRRTLRLTLYDGARGKIFEAPVGVGKPSTPTPAGRFWVREKFRVHGKPLYGTRAMGTAAYSSTLTDWPGGGVIGLHGTSEPGLIPGRPSHGCVRLKNRDIERLYALTPVGTPVLIK